MHACVFNICNARVLESLLLNFQMKNTRVTGKMSKYFF